MLQDIREKFIGTTGKIMLAVILLLLAGTGLNYTITPKRFMAKVNGQEISPRSVQNAYNQQVSRFGQQQQLPEAFLQQLQTLAVERVIERTVLQQYLEDEGFAASDVMVSRSVREVPAFQTDGVFDPVIYRRLLQQNNLTPAMFEREQRQQLIVDQFQQNLAASAFVTPEEFRRRIELVNQKREVEYATIDPTTFVDEIAVSEAQIATFYESNPTRFQTEERVNLDYLQIDDAVARARIDVSDEILMSYFDSVRDQYQGEEQRRASHVLLRTDEDAEAAKALAAELLTRVRGGESFEDIAREYSTDGGSARNGGDLGWVARGDFVGPVENAVFSMGPGQVSDVVESTFGLHIIRLDDIRDGGVPEFEAVREDVTEQFIADRLSAELLSLQEQLDDQLFASTSLEAIAAAMNLEIQSTQDFTADSVLPFGQEEALTAAVFGPEAIADGQMSGSIELEGSRTVVLRVAQRTPAGRQPLADVSGEIRAELIETQTNAIAAERGAQLAGALRANPNMDFETLTLNTGATVTAKTAIARRDAETPAALAAAVFGAPPLEDGAPHIGSVSAPGVGFIIYRLSNVIVGDASEIAPEQLDAGRRQLALQGGSVQLQALTQALRQSASVKMGDALQQLTPGS